MASTQSGNRGNLFIQLVIFIGFIIVIFVAFVLLWVYDQSNDSSRTLTYKVEGSTTQALILYTLVDGSTSPQKEVTIPWRQYYSSFPRGNLVVLTAGNPT